MRGSGAGLESGSGSHRRCSASRAPGISRADSQERYRSVASAAVPQIDHVGRSKCGFSEPKNNPFEKFRLPRELRRISAGDFAGGPGPPETGEEPGMFL